LLQALMCDGAEVPVWACWSNETAQKAGFFVRPRHDTTTMLVKLRTSVPLTCHEQTLLSPPSVATYLPLSYGLGAVFIEKFAAREKRSCVVRMNAIELQACTVPWHQ